MQAALEVFLNGVLGVLVGMMTLYLAIRLLAVIGRRPEHGPEHGPVNGPENRPEHKPEQD